MAFGGKDHDKIFGTPPEPLFSLSAGGLSVDVLENWLSTLAVQNNTLVNSVSLENQTFVREGLIVEFIFLCCERLKLCPEARYLTLELYERFLNQHIKDVHLYVTKSDNTKKEKRNGWKEIIKQIKSHMILRIVSCCQLASKLTCHYKVVTLQKARRFLSQMDKVYSEETVLQSEIRVLKTLQFKVMITLPLVYVETLLQILGHNEEDLDVKSFYGTGLKVLDLYYIRRREVYDELYMFATENINWTSKERDNFAMVECDLMLLACAVISAASYIVNHGSSNKVICCLSAITQVSGDDILDFAAILIKLIVEE